MAGKWLWKGEFSQFESSITLLPNDSDKKEVHSQEAQRILQSASCPANEVIGYHISL